MRTDDDDDDDVCDMGKGKVQFLLKFSSECQVVLGIKRLWSQEDDNNSNNNMKVSHFYTATTCLQ